MTIEYTFYVSNKSSRVEYKRSLAKPSSTISEQTALCHVAMCICLRS